VPYLDTYTFMYIVLYIEIWLNWNIYMLIETIWSYFTDINCYISVFCPKAVYML